ncbi:MAG: hypothetical protein ACLFRY_13190 [Spirochaetia bacterium]
MAIIQILIMVFSLTGAILLFVNLPFLSLSHFFPVLAFILAGASMILKSNRLKMILMVLAVILFCLFLVFIFFVFSAAGVEISA